MHPKSIRLASKSTKAKCIRRRGHPVKYIRFNSYYETAFHNRKSHAPDVLYVILHVCNVCNALEY